MCQGCVRFVPRMLVMRSGAEYARHRVPARNRITEFRHRVPIPGTESQTEALPGLTLSLKFPVPTSAQSLSSHVLGECVRGVSRVMMRFGVEYTRHRVPAPSPHNTRHRVANRGTTWTNPNPKTPSANIITEPQYQVSTSSTKPSKYLVRCLLLPDHQARRFVLRRYPRSSFALQLCTPTCSYRQADKLTHRCRHKYFRLQ